MTVVLNDTVRKLLGAPNPGVLATLNPDGSPQTSVVWVTLDGDDVLVSTEAGRRKDLNVRADGRVSLTVYDTANHYSYVELRGRATVTEDAGRAVTARIADEYAGPGAGQEYLDLPPENVRVIIRITPERVSGNAAR
ncbi:PPOX class F420-dependent oxidoreductase [Yinghuangia seranimata]|uniref:PPOX class F420-dependent oxidoreductase n=1 Tax=Yinghuangia seranimata TaxID=408067 RepID=UPI00248CC069|nr:PPOX class F420-dependent oxidoreductase [Yinghuangia seranimata]MDI2128859.1 PPOX class F420-dependent oxidoreductase [Yinghuangia seranimata]